MIGRKDLLKTYSNEKLQKFFLALFVVVTLGLSACTTAVVDNPTAKPTDAATVKKRNESTVKSTDTGSGSEEKERIMSFD